MRLCIIFVAQIKCQVSSINIDVHCYSLSFAVLVAVVAMLYQHRVVTLFIFLLTLLHLSYTSSRCSSRYCWSNWSGWTRSNTETRYRRSYCSADSIYCREGRDVSATRCPDRDYQDIVGDVETPIKKSDQELFAERLTRNENPDIQFSSEDARYMSARMISTLDYMVNELPRGFTLVIVGGYQDIEKGNASFPLQYEGMHVIPYIAYPSDTKNIRYIGLYPYRYL